MENQVRQACRKDTVFRWALEEIREHPRSYGVEMRSLRKQTIQLINKMDGRDRYDRNDQHCWETRMPTYLLTTITERSADYGVFSADLKK
jgi:hypothetical protein